ncbi:L-type lectin-domain containing receptor kinase VII.1-like [Macadamia integrifolia]|uniref:L-type lectin-domain containing receptor kinase VII.1-like n=1 Tax=Macadamia integrifolia TaxID=60698 RepID=UPI001C52A149|nr:L-type lectin-domain containing receptor kinase VII.1-like [Macadamia integrifolia]
MAIRHQFFVLLLITLFLIPVFAVDFIFNGFDSSDLLIYGNTTLESRILTLTKPSNLSLGRALYPSKIPTRGYPNSSLLLPFFTSFIFSIAPIPNYQPGHGLVFIMTPQTGIQGVSSSQHLGLFNRTNDGDSSNHVFGIEFDVFQNQEFNDINNNHVGFDLNSLTSSTAQPAGFWEDGHDTSSSSFKGLTLNNGVNYQVWIDYSGSHLNVTMARAGTKRPQRPLISTSLNLSDVLLDEMYVGFAAATGVLVEYHRILSWSFSNSNSSIGDALNTWNLPSFVPPKSSFLSSKGFIAGFTVALTALLASMAGITLFFIKRIRSKKREREAIEDWELEYWPHRINHQEIYTATKRFSDQNLITVGGNGKVYKGVLSGGTEVAVKRISHETEHGMRQFLAEVSSLGRLKHRNLVGFRGWCKRDKFSLILIYDYMENGSLDKRVFECDEKVLLGWEDRLRVLKDVASGVLYLHEGWEARVLHRDIKASNVLLDKDMNGRLGDFGLARMHSHGEAANTTRVVGTVGYLAPELVRTGRASAETDVFSFGILILEVLSGRRPVEEGKPGLVAWMWELLERGGLLFGVDERLRAKGGLDDELVEQVLRLGLLCAYSDPQARPTMRQVVKVLEGKSELNLDLNSLDDEEREGHDVYLLEKMKSNVMSSKYSSHGRSLGIHPTFDEIRHSLSSSTSLSSSDVIVDGR